jgi:phenylacetate-CoA ligase
MTKVSDQMLQFVKLAALNVPAYRDFLKQNGQLEASLESTEQFNLLPITNKENYLQKYELKDLAWGGNLNQQLIFCSTSGSTGTPFYFPRSHELAEQYSRLIEDYLNASPKPNKKPVLVIIGFGMGVWIGGVFTLQALELASSRINYPLSILPVGYNKSEIFKALRQLAPNFAQTVLVGYPPFLKEVIDEAPQEQINLAKLNLRFLMAAEAFTESFRNYICERTGANPLLDTLNIYGTADIGAIAYETPLSIMVRRIATNDPLLFQDIFGQIEKTPTLAQYNPSFMLFESVDNRVVLTGNSALPLIRYSLGDHGGVLSYDQLAKILKNNGYDLDNELVKAGIEEKTRKYPFVFVYERSSLAATLHGIIVYPEFIKEGLLDDKLTPSLTEKFTMMTKFDIHNNQYLEINLELQKDVLPDEALERLALSVLRDALISKSSEFAEISRSKNSVHLLKIIFWHYGHPKYFQPGVKQRWVQKED